MFLVLVVDSWFEEINLNCEIEMHCDIAATDFRIMCTVMPVKYFTSMVQLKLLLHSLESGKAYYNEFCHRFKN